MPHYFAPLAYLPTGWHSDVCIEVDPNGMIVATTANHSGENCQRLSGALVPGMPNLHSHAFQRAMAGLSEQRNHPHDSFWSWREQMYQVALTITPEQMYQIARYLYIELLEGGYTSVAEFHYLHHDPTGQPYAPVDEMVDAISRAATDAGIALTLLPTLYSYSDFASAPPSQMQRRFIQSTEQYLRQIERIKPLIAGRAQQRMGGCFHSLRACTAQQITQVLEELPNDWPIHLHISEQQQEVNRSLAVHGTTPLHWLSEHVELDARWCLIHATHLSEAERHYAACQQAVIGLCPSTEASLGDGIFNAVDYLAQGGRIGIGSDSHVCTDVSEELRWLEYTQRLTAQQRNCLASRAHPSTGERLLRATLQGGAQALAQPVGQINTGFRADWLMLDLDNPWLMQTPSTHLLDSWLFAHPKRAIKAVMVAGRWRVQSGEHDIKAQASQALTDALRSLRQALS
ncbi:formimidoylglutamate deiminase [Celerinatantimonas yamalensis]|uniref:Formimidoylglutamate deiminase n=1 Tax=Celerinatantimonas yamalensis TaxID=559956 RepID=A0ABW9G7I8_9GAMM